MIEPSADSELREKVALRKQMIAAEQLALEQYLAEYVLSTEGADYVPTEEERELIADALQGWLADREDLMREHGFDDHRDALIRPANAAGAPDGWIKLPRTVAESVTSLAEGYLRRTQREGGSWYRQDEINTEQARAILSAAPPNPPTTQRAGEQAAVKEAVARAIHGYDERHYDASAWEELSPKQREHRFGQANRAISEIPFAREPAPGFIMIRREVVEQAVKCVEQFLGGGYKSKLTKGAEYHGVYGQLLNALRSDVSAAGGEGK